MPTRSLVSSKRSVSTPGLSETGKVRASTYEGWILKHQSVDEIIDLNEGMADSIFSRFTTDIPLSPSLETAFNSAKSFQACFHYQQVEPLRLLAAFLKEASSRGVKLLQGSGITQENFRSSSSLLSGYGFPHTHPVTL